jgi:PAS domain S-box-containing protein
MSAQQKSVFLPEADPSQMTEVEWRRREGWMRELLQASNDGFWEWNTESGAVTFSGRWAEMLGYLPGDIEPHVGSWEKLVHPDDLPAVMRTLQDHLDGKAPYYETEHRLRCKDGSWRWILDRGRVVERGPDGRALRAAGAHIDVTERKKHEQEKEQVSRERQEVLGVVSHELKNPIHAILSAVEILSARERKIQPGRTPDARVLDLLDTLMRAVERMNKLVNDLLLTTRLESGAPLLQMDFPCVGSLLRETLRVAASDAEAKRINLELALSDLISGRELQADSSRIQQVLVNLLDNAIRFTPAGGKIRVGAACDEAVVRIRVEDSGPGVKMEERGKVFQRFWQSRNAAYQGTGLGLFIADRIVRAHGGTIEVKDSSLGGAEFAFTLPLKRTGVNPRENTGLKSILPKEEPPARGVIG